MLSFQYQDFVLTGEETHVIQAKREQFLESLLPANRTTSDPILLKGTELQAMTGLSSAGFDLRPVKRKGWLGYKSIRGKTSCGRSYGVLQQYKQKPWRTESLMRLKPGRST